MCVLTNDRKLCLDFDSKYKIVWGETRAHRVPIHEEEKKFKTKIYIIIPIFPPPIIIPD